MKVTAFLIKYGEIAIKGKNRYMFEDALMKQIRHAMAPVGDFKVRKESGRMFVEAQDVNKISLGLALNVFAINSCAAFTLFSASIPFICFADGFPYVTCIASCIASTTSGNTQVVAALSK